MEDPEETELALSKAQALWLSAHHSKVPEAAEWLCCNSLCFGGEGNSHSRSSYLPPFRAQECWLQSISVGWWVLALGGRRVRADSQGSSGISFQFSKSALKLTPTSATHTCSSMTIPSLHQNAVKPHCSHTYLCRQIQMVLGLIQKWRNGLWRAPGGARCS